MDEDDIKELLLKSGQMVPSSQMQRPTSVPPPILSGSGERNVPPPLHHQNLEIASWLHHPNRQDYFCSGVASTPATHPQSSVSLAPPPTPYPNYSPAERMAENYMNFSTLRENVFAGGRVEARPLIPVVRESTQVGSSTFSATGTYLTPATFFGGVSSTFAVPRRGQKDKAVAIQTAFEIARTSSSCTKTEPVQIQPATETEIADERKPKEREETFAAIQVSQRSNVHFGACYVAYRELKKLVVQHRGRGHELQKCIIFLKGGGEKDQREDENSALIPRCNKNDKASMLDDVIDYVKTLQMQVQMMSMGYGVMPPMMYEANMQRFIPHMAMGMNRPPPFVTFPREAHTAGPTPSYQALHNPFPNIQASLPSLQPDSYPVSNQPQFPAYMNPYSQFGSLHQMQQPPPLQSNNITTEFLPGKL